MSFNIATGLEVIAERVVEVEPRLLSDVLTPRVVSISCNAPSATDRSVSLFCLIFFFRRFLLCS
jgi:hypothetical protein